MEALQTLIDQTYSYSIDPGEGYESLSKCYLEDMTDFTKVGFLIKEERLVEASEFIFDMDTLPREQVLGALDIDLGKDWVRTNLEGIS